MKKTARMMLMNGRRDYGDRPESRYDSRTMDNYDVDGKFIDDRGREHYDNGRYAPMRSEYMSPYSHYTGYEDYPGRVHPVYEKKVRRTEYPPMNKIGFSIDGEMGKASEFDKEYRTRADYNNMNEMEHRKGERTNGYAMSREMPMTKEMANDWVDHMENEDGSMGPHWDMEQAQKVMAQREIDGSPVEFWVALNATYSDLCKVFRKYGISNLDAYVDFAKAFWLDDKDAVPNKLAAYYDYVVKH